MKCFAINASRRQTARAVRSWAFAEKSAEVANLQDLLIFQIKGISCYGKALLAQGEGD